MVKSESMRTLPVGLLQFDSAYNKATHLMMAASVMSIVPPLLLFVVGQRYLVSGLQLGAVKGVREGEGRRGPLRRVGTPMPRRASIAPVRRAKRGVRTWTLADFGQAYDVGNG